MDSKSKAAGSSPGGAQDSQPPQQPSGLSELQSLPTTVRAAHETSFDDWSSGLPVPPPAEGEEASEWGDAPTLAPEPAEQPTFETVHDDRIPGGQDFFKIGEVSKIVGVKPYVLRYWESELAVIRPEKTSTRQRRYRREDVAILLQVRRLRHDEKLSIARIRVLLRRTKNPGTQGPILDPINLPSTAGHAQGSVITPSVRAALQDELQDMRRAVMALLEAVEE